MAEKADWIIKNSGLQSFKANKPIFAKILPQKWFLNFWRKNEKSLFLKIQGHFWLWILWVFFLEKIQYFFRRKSFKKVKNGPLTPKICLVIKWVKSRPGKKLASFLPRNGRFEAQKMKFPGSIFDLGNKSCRNFRPYRPKKQHLLKKNFFFEKYTACSNFP